MERGCLLIKTIELPTHSTKRLVEGGKLCTIVFLRLFMKILVHAIYHVERQVKGFS